MFLYLHVQWRERHFQTTEQFVKTPTTLAIDPYSRAYASIHDLHVFFPKVVDCIDRFLGGPACTQCCGNQTYFGLLLKFQIKPFERLSCCDDMFIVERNGWNSI
ncbi:hypothetical protein EV128_10788 [Rhizobium azibense]|nr:hypothetical protein EV128_10788 [Rhizobium azibense]